MHYTRWKRHGDPTVNLRDISESDRFVRLTRRTRNGCLEWQGSRSPKGYGYFHFRGKMVSAHRVAWILVHGRIPRGKYVCHKCDNPPCVDEAHLFLGTNSENMLDSIRKGRKKYPRGSRHPLALLSDDDVRDIRNRWPKMTQTSLAEEYGVSVSLIWLVVHRRHY